jgi:hypothetical protein
MQHLKPEKMEIPPHPDNLGKKLRTWKAIDGNPVHVTITGEIKIEQSIAAHKKLICLQQIRFEADGHTEYRFTYYMIGVKEGKTKGRWVFGQYSLVIPAEDLKILLAKAREAGWEGF